MTGRQAGTVALAWAGILTAGCIDRPGAAISGAYDLGEPSATHLLPPRLREISGLATTADGRLLAHDDERAVVYQIDPDTGRLIKAFGLGDPVARGDFEGIAVAHDRIYLVTSDGHLYGAREGADDERVRFELYITGVGDSCEVEGLAFDPASEALVLACKEARIAELRGRVALFRWALTTREVLGPPEVIEIRDLGGPTGLADFRPSGLEIRPGSGNLLLVAGPQRAVAEIAADGRVISVYRLDPRRHPQPEGVTLGADGRLILADEGRGLAGRLTLYAAPIRSASPP